MAYSDGMSRAAFEEDAVHDLSRIHLIHMPSWSSAFPEVFFSIIVRSRHLLTFILDNWILFQLSITNNQCPMIKD